MKEFVIIFLTCFKEWDSCGLHNHVIEFSVSCDSGLWKVLIPLAICQDTSKCNSVLKSDCGNCIFLINQTDYISDSNTLLLLFIPDSPAEPMQLWERKLDSIPAHAPLEEWLNIFQLQDLYWECLSKKKNPAWLWELRVSLQGWQLGEKIVKLSRSDLESLRDINMEPHSVIFTVLLFKVHQHFRCAMPPYLNWRLHNTLKWYLIAKRLP